MSRSIIDGIDPPLEQRLMSADMPRAYVVGGKSPLDEAELALRQKLVGLAEAIAAALRNASDDVSSRGAAR